MTTPIRRLEHQRMLHKMVPGKAMDLTDANHAAHLRNVMKPRVVCGAEGVERADARRDSLDAEDESRRRGMPLCPVCFK